MYCNHFGAHNSYFCCIKYHKKIYPLQELIHNYLTLDKRKQIAEEIATLYQLLDLYLYKTKLVLELLMYRRN